MAEGYQFVCSACGYTIEAWSDGNPYVVDESGRKRYVYHPSEGFDLAIGNDSPHLCLACGRKFKVDSRKPRATCPKCQSDQISDAFTLGGKPCPKCRRGAFAADPAFFAIS
jgi:DNA-directed RNA polymerase subunit RPC12/RpoP